MPFFKKCSFSHFRMFYFSHGKRCRIGVLKAVSHLKDILPIHSSMIDVLYLCRHLRGSWGNIATKIRPIIKIQSTTRLKRPLPNLPLQPNFYIPLSTCKNRLLGVRCQKPRCRLAEHLGFHGARKPRLPWCKKAQGAGATAGSLASVRCLTAVVQDQLSSFLATIHMALEEPVDMKAANTSCLPFSTPKGLIFQHRHVF